MGKARNMALLSVDTSGAIGSTNLTNAPNPIVAGAIQSWPSNTIPSGWLKCNGAAVSRTLYSSLFSAIGTTYGTGDGSTTFNLPDMRGEFLRGLDDGRGVDSSRSLGSFQADELRSHVHDQSRNTASGTLGSLGVQGVNVNNNGYSSGVNGTGATGGAETRPRNVAMHYIIKY